MNCANVLQVKAQLWTNFGTDLGCRPAARGSHAPPPAAAREAHAPPWTAARDQAKNSRKIVEKLSK